MWHTPLSIVSAGEGDAPRFELGACGRDVGDLQGERDAFG